MAPDGGDQENITDNVMLGSGYVSAVQLGSQDGTVFRHNTVKNIQVQTGSKVGGSASRNVVVQDNAFAQGADLNPDQGSGCSSCPTSYNLFATSNAASGTNAQVGAPVFSGGATPSSYSGYALASNSPGKANASDGADRGIRVSGATQPPPPAGDTTAPDTTITSGPTGTSNDSTPTFAFTATEANSVFECRVDSGTWANCTSPWTTGALSDGAHSVAVRATDVAGNTDASPATRSFTVDTAPAADTTAPDTTITSGPTGTSNDSTPTFAFTATEANSVFECRVDSGTWANCTSPWTTSTLSDGAHSVAVRATDVAGNTDATPATRSFTVDTSTPADTTAPDTTISSGPTGTTSATTASFAFTATETGSTFECKLDAGAYAACTSPKDYTALSAGSHTFSVRATDAADNTDASPATRTWTVQAAPTDHQPTAAYDYSPASPTAGQAVSFDASSATCQDTPCTYTWEDDGPDGPGGGQWPLGSGSAMTFTFQDPGVKNVRLTVTDGDGDTNSMMTAITVGAAGPPADTTAPDTTITSGPTGTTSDSTPTFAFTATESGSTFQCRVDSGTWASCTSPWTTSALADGAHSVSVRATDPAANTDASPATRSFTVSTAAQADTTPPDTTIGSGPSGPTNDSTPTFAFTATESGSTFQCRVDSGTWASCTSPWTTSALADGAHSVSVRANDAAGNTDASPATRSLTVDTQAPNTTIASAPPALSPGSSATVTFSSADGGVSFECQLDGGAWTPCTSPTTFTGLALGQHTANVRATDAAGNVDASPATAGWTSIAVPVVPGPPASGGTDSANEAPTVSLAAPTAGSTFTSTLNMSAAASDDHAVRRVEFWFDGTRVARDTSAPYTATFAANKATSYGVHTVSVRAFDASGAARSAAVTVTRVRRAATTTFKAAAASATHKARGATSSDMSQSVLVGVSMWRLTSAPAADSGTVVRGRGTPGQSASVSLTRCGDASGTVAAVAQMNAGADGTLYVLEPADGLCVLRVKPFGDS